MAKTPTKPPRRRENGMEFLSVRLPSEVMRKLERNGKKHERNLSAEVRHALRQYVEKLGRAA